jgi:hypothetical protein
MNREEHFEFDVFLSHASKDKVSPSANTFDLYTDTSQ